MPKRPEIKPADFAKALEDEPVAVIPFEPQLFGTAANNGQMIAEVSSEPSRPRRRSAQLAQLLTGRTEVKKPKREPADAAARQADGASRREARGDQSCSASVAHRVRRAVRRRRQRRRAAPQPRAAPPRRAAAAATSASRRCPSAGLGAPITSPPPTPGRGADAGRRRSRTDTRRSESYYEIKGTIFGALIEAIDLAQLAQLDADVGARGNPRHRQRDHRDQEHRDVDRRAGRAARRHLQRRARLRPARAAARARRHRRHHGERRRHGLHRSRRQDPEDRHPLPRQPAASEHLPAHRQPGRPPRRRILADLRRAPARRLARQRHRAAARDRRPRAHHPQVQEGQADARPARQVRLDHAGRRRSPARSSAAAASTC